MTQTHAADAATTQASTAVGVLWPASTRFLPSGDITISDVSLLDVVAEHGTAAYVLDVSEFRARCENYRSAFSDAEVAYAGKALLTRAVVHLVDEQGLVLDVCSEGELAVAVSADFPVDRIVVHGNGKSRSFLSLATRLRVGRIVVDSLDEITALAVLADPDDPQPVLVRVTPGVDAGTHAAITTGTEDQKFGLSIRSGAAAAAVRRILELPSLRALGVHCHIGSQICRTDPYVETVRRMVAFVAAMRAEFGVQLPQLNIGGGHAIAYRPGDAALSPDRLAAAVRGALETACYEHGVDRPRLSVEPGRAIAGPSGVTVYQVLNVKRAGTRTWVAVDGGMSDNPRPALYGSRYTARLFGRVPPAELEQVTIVGRHCEAGDVLVEQVMLPADIGAGDLLAVPATGAYHHGMSSNYNLTPRPPLIGVEAGRTRLLVRREELADLLSRDVG